MNVLEQTVTQFVRTMPEDQLLALIHGYLDGIALQAIRNVAHEHKAIHQKRQTSRKVTHKAAQGRVRKESPRSVSQNTHGPMTDAAEKVYRAVQRHKKFTSKQLSLVTGMGDTTVRDHLKRLCEKGKVRREVDGKRVLYFVK